MSDEVVDPVAEKRALAEDEAAAPQTRDEKEKQAAFNTFSQEKNEDGVNMNVKVYSPSQVYYDGLAFSLTAVNGTGEFDVLPKHHPFICLLSACDMEVRTVSEGNRTITISGGLMHVKEDKIIVFLDI